MLGRLPRGGELSLKGWQRIALFEHLELVEGCRCFMLIHPCLVSEELIPRLVEAAVDKENCGLGQLARGLLLLGPVKSGAPPRSSPSPAYVAAPTPVHMFAARYDSATTSAKVAGVGRLCCFCPHRRDEPLSLWVLRRSPAGLQLRPGGDRPVSDQRPGAVAELAP